jgi:hypothetical protein
VFGHILWLEQATMTFYRHFFGDVCSQEVLSIQRRIRAVLAAKVSQTKAANRRLNRRLIPARTEAK